MRALVTGGSRGIGKSIKDLFEQRGIEVCAPSRSQMDLADPQSIVGYTAALGHVDIVINCAGINVLTEMEHAEDEMIYQMFQTNLLSNIQLIKCVIPSMKQKGYGRIVNFSSIWSKFSKNARMLYSSAKAGVNGLTTALGVELSPYGILTNAIAPGFINTEMTTINNAPPLIESIKQALPIKRLGEPIEVAELAYFLSVKNTYITGQTIFIDGGFSCV